MDGIQPTYNVGGNGDGFGNSWIFLFGILALFGLGGNGFFGGNSGNTNAIQADVNRGFDNQNLQAQTRDIMGAVTSGTAQSVAATNQVFHDMLFAFNDKYNELQRDVAGLAVGQANALANASQCCCETKMLIQQTAADNALALAQMEARINSKMDGNEIRALQNKVNQLELNQAVAGVVRYPSQTTYTSGVNPFCGCGCNGNI